MGKPWGPAAEKITVDKDDFERLFHDLQAVKAEGLR